MQYIIKYKENNIDKQFVIDENLKYSIRKIQQNGQFKITLYYVTENFSDIKNSQLNELHNLLSKGPISDIHIYQTINNKEIEIFAFEEEIIYQDFQLGLEVVPATEREKENKMELRLFIG